MKLQLVSLLLLIGLPALSQVVELPDDRIEQNVENELHVSQRLNGDAIDVSVNQASAKLTGTVTSLYEKRQAETIASMSKGIVSVINEIEVNDFDLSDQQIQKRVEKALLLDPATEEYELEINVDDGMVSVFGVVQSLAEEKLIDEVVTSVRGVRGVEVAVDVDHSAERKDVSLEEDMIGLVESDVRLNPKDFKVDVDQGKMKLSGSIGTMYEKNIMESHAWTSGASDVVMEELTIDSEMRQYDASNAKAMGMSDDEIEAALSNAFSNDPRLQDFQLSYAAHDGTVHLDGQVSNLRAKQAAEEDALNVAGVVAVTNEIKVNPPETNDQASIQASVEERLADHALLTDSEVRAEVDEGIVILSGIVESNFLRYVAESVASGVYGVTSVENQIETRTYPGYYTGGTKYEMTAEERSKLKPDQSDSAIEEGIEYQLMWSPFVDMSDITIEVKGGVAIVEGQIDSERERRAVIANAYEGGAIAVESALFY